MVPIGVNQECNHLNVSAENLALLIRVYKSFVFVFETYVPLCMRLRRRMSFGIHIAPWNAQEAKPSRQK